MPWLQLYTKMEAAVDKLEAMFQKADSDLNYISRKLDTEFAADAEHSTQPNPAKMLEKIADIKKEYSVLVKEAEAIKDAQKEAVTFFQTQLMSACEALQRLQNQAGMEESEKSAELHNLESLLGVQLPSVEAQKTQSDSNQDSQAVAQDPDEGSSANQRVAPSVAEAGNNFPVLSARETRENQSNDFLEVTEQEFLSVSNLIRGRVKLEDVNKTYQGLWDHFKEEGNSKPLTTAEMHKMGLRITGQTGEAKLKVLRALKLINLSSKGDVTLP
ncbi:spindle and kinetochore-associated protein 2 [Lingula anatina]|uniref:Protein FAM33A n=1 Tax=Lingula anatina TaxID=7574 RepID=A0A1S3JPU8_LINAN|nr:spindle and kinetochore-associated protein 2 [Lingula anatina]|eukprot:XP_013412161.1 spindle and kinetochore-associated protein 2 [Lingula anatina]